MELTYREENGYLLPNVTVPKAAKVGICGMRRKEYLLKNKRPLYIGMQLSGKLNAHLEEVDRQAAEMMETLVSQMAHQEGITEALKDRDQMSWVGAMNNIRQRVEEIVRRELIEV